MRTELWRKVFEPGMWAFHMAMFGPLLTYCVYSAPHPFTAQDVWCAWTGWILAVLALQFFLACPTAKKERT